MSRRTQPIELSIHNIIKSYLNKLEDVWNDLGISEQQVAQRSDKVCEHIVDLMENMLDEEEHLKQTVQENYNRFKEEIFSLRKELGLNQDCTETSVLLEASCVSVPGMRAGSLYLREKNARKEVLRLHEMKKLKKQALESLLAEEDRLCIRLNCKPLSIASIFINATLDEKIKLVSERNRKMLAQAEQRLQEYTLLRVKICKKLDEIGFDPSEFICLVVKSEEPPFALSEENLQKIKHFEETIEMQYQVSVARQIVCDIEDLWNKLDVDIVETTQFRRKYFNFLDQISTAEMQLLKQEKSKLQSVWSANISQLTAKANKTLHDLRLEGFLLDSSDEEQVVQVVMNQVDREEVLLRLESQIKDARILLRDRDHVVKKLNAWKEAFDRITELEVKTNDPNRLRNRGGKLLLEEKERKQLRKKIIKIEKSVFDTAKIWLETTSTSDTEFHANGLPLHEFFNHQWKLLEELKDDKHNKRNLKRKQETEEEMRYGSSNPQKNPKTCGKRVKYDTRSSANESSVSTSASDKSTTGGYMTPWGAIRASPIKSTVTSRFGTFPGRRVQKKDAKKIQVPKTTDCIETRSQVTNDNFKQRKLRRRSKSLSNLTCALQVHDVRQDKPQKTSRFKLKLPSGVARPNPEPRRNLVRNLPQIQVETEDKQNQEGQWNASNLPDFSETLRNQQHIRELEDSRLPEAHQFDQGLFAIVKEEPYTRSSAIGLHH